MEDIIGVLLLISALFIFYKMLSMTVKIFFIFAILGLLGSTVGLFFPNKTDLPVYQINTTDTIDEKPNNKYISKIISQDKIALVIIQSAGCAVCKVNKILSLNTNSFANLLAENNVEVIYDSVNNIDNQYPEILLHTNKSNLPLNVVFSKANPFGRVLNKLLTKNYLTEQINEESSICGLFLDQDKNLENNKDEVSDILNTLKEREEIILTAESSQI
ncbi:MAG: hypothetical protein JJW01_01730 [Alphaproteobacteria bacterium]|nr:hypothetical protein [Rickettsiales bacterium]